MDEAVQLLVDKGDPLIQRLSVSVTPGVDPSGDVAWGGRFHEALNF